MIPADAELTARHAEIPAWDDVPDDLKPVLARQMEIYAGFLEHTDHEIGRLIDALADLEILDDTLIYYIIGDNGASAEGGINGCFNEVAALNGAGFLETTEFMVSRIDDFGTPRAYNHYAVGWAHAMCTPYQWTKQVASHWGGTRNGTIVHWPNGIAAKGELRHQFSHVIDVAPTVLEVAGLPEPTFVNGVQQIPYEGVSHALRLRRRRRAGASRDAVLRDVLQPRHLPQRLDRGDPPQHPVGDDGRSCRPSTTTCGSCTPTPTGPRPTTSPPSNPNASPSCNGCGCWRCPSTTCCPSTTGGSSGSTPTSPDGPTLVRGNQQLLFAGMGRLSENSVLNLKNKSHSVTAQITVPDGGANGVIISQGGAFGGWSLYLVDGRPRYCYNLFGLQQFHVAGDAPVPPATTRCASSSPTTAAGSARVAPRRCSSTATRSPRDASRPPCRCSSPATRPATSARTPPHPSPTTTQPNPTFTGRIHWVQLDIGDDDHDHLITPEQRLRVAMTRQ